MTNTSVAAKARDTVFADHLAAQYRAIGPAAVQAAVLTKPRQRPLLTVSTVQETD
ncbi:MULTISPECIES: hypothetical protein [Pseudomonadota]|jgi:hypothetical protein|uniref:Uncharacterized protein n=1 Tax=Phyllobacterium myrsinacearum TaxID=28101 RepID=A0A839EJ77_9HYPH|nr:hypothetical protein [Phyllobacterium myrsinacearum]MBQ9353605.1 hypothetical protein [Phyllobacterium sp.]MBA8876557.1 hypothetical protein [Phyllobacterium myrsinacearum]PWV88247.1 hypothetical protein DEV92_11154 [Phyllobacterium myrsinacearum]RZS88691.1 hypothetical protein EV217_1078 [Phyllobacterium myrsinacearum]RZU97538.1 hypothetical protein EV654_4398 [Phyllobacterium myrsinacearum]